MLSLFHQLQNGFKQHKVLLFGRPQRIRVKKWKDLLLQVRDGTHTEAIQRLFVIIVTPVNVDATTSEELLNCLESGQTFGSLSHYEFRKHLPAKLHHSTALNRDGKATFSVDKSNDPSDCFQPFLLIICTHHVVTAFFKTSSVGFSDFPAYGQV